MNQHIFIESNYKSRFLIITILLWNEEDRSRINIIESTKRRYLCTYEYILYV